MKSKLMKNFAGVYVSVIMESIRGVQNMSDGSSIEGNVIIDGYLLDEDDEFYYLGKEQEQVTEALLKADVRRIYVAKEVDEFDFDVDTDGESH